VVSYASSGSASPAGGVSVTGASAPVSTDAAGNATVTFTAPGAATLEVSAPNAVRDEAPVCVHRGEDGSCAALHANSLPEVLPGGGPTHNAGGSSPGNQVLSSGPDALVAKVSSVRNGATYPRGKAPRLLAGRILAHLAVTAVSLELRRSYKGRCYSYEALRARFVGAHCGKGHSFRVSSGATFSYLLPKRLAPGRYQLDVSATDAAGERTTPVLGSSRLIFRVR